jgi:hypothetical protein
MDNRVHTNTNAESVLLPSQWACSCWNSTILDQKNLNQNGEENDSCEKEIVKETSENVVFFRTKFSRVNFIENLHKDEGVEEQGVMLGFLGSFHVTCGIVDLKERCVIFIGKTKDLSSPEEEHNKKCCLPEGLSDDISPHDRCNNKFMSAVRGI